MHQSSMACPFPKEPAILVVTAVCYSLRPLVCNRLAAATDRARVLRSQSARQR